MLEFNEKHKIVDLSNVKQKIDKSKNIGKVLLCGVALSSILLLSGCKVETNATTKTSDEEIAMANDSEIEETETAIIMENGSALIIPLMSNNVGASSVICLYTLSNDILLVSAEDCQIIEGENSYEKAIAIAETLISENGKISFYDDAKSNEKTR